MSISPAPDIDKSKVSLRRLLTATAAAPAAAFAMMLTALHPVCATQIDYTISPGATLTFADLHTEQLSGAFVFDTSVNQPISGSLVLAGPAPEAGTYDFQVTGGGVSVIASTSGPISSSDTLLVSFTDFLTDDTVDPLESGNWSAYDPPEIFVDSSTGDAVPASIPEPASLSILAAAIMLFGLTGRASLRDRSR